MCIRDRYKDTTLGINHISKEILNEKKTNKNNGDLTLKEKTWLFELEQIEKALAKYNGNKSEAAAYLKSDLDQVRNKVKKIYRERSDIIDHFDLIKKLYL